MTFLFDTNILLNFKPSYFDNLEEKFYLSSITINELEEIKSSGKKDEETKYNARKILHWLEDNQDKYEIIVFHNDFYDIIDAYNLPKTTDSSIIATAYQFYKNVNLEYPKDSRYFVTDDLACRAIARSIGIPVYDLGNTEEEEYTGYKIIKMDNDNLSEFYNNIYPNNVNKFNLLTNEYLLIENEDKIVDKYKWIGDHYETIPFIKFESTMFGKLTAKDHYQSCIMDSLMNNQLNVIRGCAGSGKSLIGLAYLFQELERNHIDKIIMFVNPVATKDSCKFGFLPGTFLEKVLGSQIGNFLSSKLGSMEAVYQLIDQRKLEFIALADARGYDTSDMKCGIYITEAQNANIEMMKLILSRIGEDTPCIIEGDNDMQTDISSYEGKNNGLRRTCEIFKGEDYFGTITLQNCYRSRIAERALKM